MTVNTITTAGTPNVVTTTNTAGSAGAPAAPATTAANTAAAADIANVANTMAAITTLSTTDQTVAAPKSEAVQAGQQAEAAPTQQSSAGKDVNSSQAFSVALEGNISNEIAELARTIANRTALIKSLPPEIRELVQQVLNQNQAAQTALADGLVALLKSPRTVGENLTMLVDLMETAAGLSEQEAVQTQLPARTAADKQQLLSESVTIWLGETPEDAAALAKVLRELAVSLPAADKMQKPQDTAVTLPRANTTGNTQSAMPQATTVLNQATQTPEATAAAKVIQVAAEQVEQMPGSTASVPADDAQALQTSARQQNTPANPTAVANNPAVIQRLAQSLQNLPPEMQEFVLNLLQQDEATMPVAQTLRNLQQPAQTPQASQNPQASPATPAQAANQAQIVTQTSAASPDAPGSAQQPALTGKVVTATTVLQTGQQLPQVSMALAELLSSLNKSRKSPLEKITELANFMDQAADILAQEPKNTQTAALRQQALVEMAEMLQEKSPEELKAAMKVVQELADTMAKPSGVTAERQEAQKVLTMAIPLYFGDGQTAYPAYIHIYYQEQEDKKNPGQKVPETWLRVCLETENIGVVDVAFRLYDENNLDVKVRFTEEEAAIGFARGIEEVKEQLRQLPLTLGDILVK